MLKTCLCKINFFKLFKSLIYSKIFIFHRISLLNDSLNLILLEISAFFGIIPLSTIFCKVFQSLVEIIPAYSAWILVFISAERFILIVYSGSKLAKLIGHKWVQLTFLFLVFIFCFFYYSINWIFFKITFVVFSNESIDYYESMVNESIAVCYIDNSIFEIASYMNVFFSCLIPFIALITSSLLIIYSMTKLRRRISHPNSTSNKKREKRDFEFARTILSLDLIFLLFKFPFNFFILASNYFTVHWNSGLIKDVAVSLLYFNYIGTGINFLVYILFNHNFRSEFFKLIDSNSLAL